MEIIIWLFLFVLLVVIELVTVQLVTIWFAVGALGAAIAAMLQASLEIQLIIFLVLSILLLASIRPLASRFFTKSITKTNVDELIGKHAKVTALINNKEGFGSAMVNGQEWTAVSEEDAVVIEPGTEVEIVRISGVKLVVRQRT